MSNMLCSSVSCWRTWTPFGIGWILVPYSQHIPIVGKLRPIQNLLILLGALKHRIRNYYLIRWWRTAATLAWYLYVIFLWYEHDLTQRTRIENKDGYLVGINFDNSPILAIAWGGGDYPEINMFEVWEDCYDLVFIAESGDEGNDFVTSSMSLAYNGSGWTLDGGGVLIRSKYGQDCS